MRCFYKRVVCVCLAAALLCACGLPVLAVNEYLKNTRWHAVTVSEATAKLQNGDTFIVDCYRESCGNSKYVGAKVMMDWMDTYGKDLYGVNVDASEGVPSWVWEAMGKTSGTLPFVAFVKGGEVTAFSPETTMADFVQKLNDTFFAFYTDVTKMSLTIVTPPEKTVYQTEEPLDTTGMTLQAVYVDGSTETVSEGFTCSGFSSDTPGHKTVTVTYGTMETTFAVTVNTPDGVPSVWIEQPAKTKLRYGNTTTLSADFCNLPDQMHVEWSYSRRTIRGIETKTGSGSDFTMAAKGFSQTVTVTAAMTDADGKPVLAANGEPVAAQHTIRFQNNIFFRLVYWIDSLFKGSGCSSEL